MLFCDELILVVCIVVEVKPPLATEAVVRRERGEGDGGRLKNFDCSEWDVLSDARLASAFDATSLWESLVSRIQVREECW